MGFLITLAFAALWYLPFFIKHRKCAREKARYYVFALLMSLPAVIAATLAELGFGLALRNVRPEGVLYEVYGFGKTFVTVAVVEELLKFFFGWLVLRKVPDLTEGGSMLLLGMTGLGFELAESVVAEPISAVLRGLTALHIFFQMWMGKYWWRAAQADRAGDRASGKKLRRKAFLVPILMHAVFDYPILRLSPLVKMENPPESQIILGVCLALAAILFGFGCMIFLFRDARRTVKAEKEAHQKRLEAEAAARLTEQAGTTKTDPGAYREEEDGEVRL